MISVDNKLHQAISNGEYHLNNLNLILTQTYDLHELKDFNNVSMELF